MGDVTLVADVVEDGVPFASFAVAAGAVLRLMQDRLKLRLWMVTRAVDGEQVVLQFVETPGSGYGMRAGSVLPWDESLCASMVAGLGLCVAPRAVDVPAYAAAGNRRQMAIEAYVGVPLRHRDGALFGTLCGFDPDPQPDSLRGAAPLVLLQARLLSTVLASELDREYEQRRAERAEADAARDALTGLPNRRAWDAVLVAEDARSRRYGHPGSVLMVDLNGLKTVNDSRGHAAGDRLLRRCARVLTATARASDFVARLGGDEFGILVAETDHAGARAQAARLRLALDAAPVDAAIGVGFRTASGSFESAQHEADASMYADKRDRRP